MPSICRILLCFYDTKFDESKFCELWLGKEEIRYFLFRFLISTLECLQYFLQYRQLNQEKTNYFIFRCRLLPPIWDPLFHSFSKKIVKERLTAFIQVISTLRPQMIRKLKQFFLLSRFDSASDYSDSENDSSLRSGGRRRHDPYSRAFATYR